MRWSSPNEVFITPDEQKVLSNWRETDQRIGNNAEILFGSTPPEISFPSKVIRKFKNELKKFTRPFSQTLSGVGLYARRKISRNVICDMDDFTLNGIQFKVIALDKTNTEINRLVSLANADYFVLTRVANSFFKEAAELISEEILATSPELLYGDFMLSDGTKFENYPFSRLLLRQVDFLGPVIVVSRKSLEDCLSHNHLPPLLWPIFLGLNLQPAQISHIDTTLGLGESIQSFPHTLATELVKVVLTELAFSELKAEVKFISPGRLEIKYFPKTSPLVSIIIPTRGSGQENNTFVVSAVDSILKKSTYRQFEICIVADAETPQFVITQIDEMCKQQNVSNSWIRWSEAFHFSKTMNLGSVISRGELLLFLNDDTEVVAKDWIDRMVSLLQVENIKNVGALLFFEDQSVQHAGHLYKGGAGHIGFGESLRLNDPQQVFSVDRIVSGVTAACSMVPRTTFAEIGGFTELFPGNYNDVDLSLKIELCGYTSAISSHSRLYHFESKTRDATVSAEDLWKLNKRWRQRLASDPWWNN